MIELNSETYNIPDLDADVVIISDEFLLNQNELHRNDLRGVRSIIGNDNTEFEYDWDNSIFENHNNDDIYYGANTTWLNQIIFNQCYYKINIDNNESIYEGSKYTCKDLARFLYFLKTSLTHE